MTNKLSFVFKLVSRAKDIDLCKLINILQRYFDYVFTEILMSYNYYVGIVFSTIEISHAFLRTDKFLSAFVIIIVRLFCSTILQSSNQRIKCDCFIRIILRFNKAKHGKVSVGNNFLLGRVKKQKLCDSSKKRCQLQGKSRRWKHSKPIWLEH